MTFATGGGAALTPALDGKTGVGGPAFGGLALLPDFSGAHPHIMIGCGKDGAVYVLDRDNLGHFNSSGDTQIIQVLYNQVGSITINPKKETTYVQNCYSTTTYWNGRLKFTSIQAPAS